MRLASGVLLLALAAGIAFADPGHIEEKPWTYPDGWIQFRTEYNEQEPNDTCPGPLTIACGDVVYAELNPSGDWDWFPFSTDMPYRVTIGTDDDPNNPQGTDTYLELWSGDCSVLLAEDDDGGPGFYSLLIEELPAGDYNIKVRGYGDFSTGTYMMFLTCVEPPPPPENDTCEDAEELGYFIERCTTGTLYGDLTDATNDYSPTNGCTGYSFGAEGKDVVYVMDLVAGDVVDLIYTEQGYDAAMHILTDCNDMNSCVIGADDPEEILGWIVPATGRYYLVIDAYCTDCGGPWTLDYSIECGCECEVVVTDILDLGDGRCKYLLYGITDCDVSNDLHFDLLDPDMVTLIGCSVPPESSWFCDVDGNSVNFWTMTQPIPPGEPIPLMDLVMDFHQFDHICAPFNVRFTLDGYEFCSTEVCLDFCAPVPVTEKSWGAIKSMFR
jgi:hypothetical protein